MLKVGSVHPFTLTYGMFLYLNIYKILNVDCLRLSLTDHTQSGTHFVVSKFM